ncbi:HDOD domain-containing protein [Neptuniibacter sp.]|uniref:HDOD domain-containing protein n=1 Tax=Neptuniibacter sp. TaxID=1962643 RepID=UPI003B58E6FB
MSKFSATPTSYVIPSRPQVLIDLTKELRKSSPDIDKISSLIKQDVALYSSVIATVNSAYYGFSTEITSIKHAVTILGLNQVFNITRLAALKNSLPSLGPMERFWDTATEVASISSELALKFTNFDSNEAYTLGMLHDIGIPLLTLAKSEFKDFLRELNGYSLTETYNREMEHYGISHYQLGAELIRKWKISENIADAVQLQPHYQKTFNEPIDNSENKRLYLCLLLLARDISDEYRHFWRIPDNQENLLDLKPVLGFLGISDYEYNDLKEDIVSKLTNQHSG